MGICVSCRRRERKAPEKRSGAGLGAGGPGKGPAAAELLPRRVDHLPAMANSISNIKMTNPIKGIVSKRRKRYIKDGFNLDLAYITDRLIAMGFPAEKLEGVYRNHIDEVSRFLEQMHKDHYKIYNLCSERSYDSSKFHERVERYAFEDHTPPNMELIQPFCEDVHNWLSADSRNVAAVHCKAGKGRTGTMVCCYLLYSGQKATADEALQFYGTKRTHDEKGVTIPSQRRYVEYYAELVRSGLQYTATKVYIRELVMCPPPMLNGGQCTLELTVSQAQPPFKAPHGCHEVRKHARCVRVCLTHCTPLHGDVRVDVYNKPKMMMRKEKLFHFWFNTFFVVAEVGAQRIPPPADSPNQETYKLTLNKWQLDDAHKDKQHKLYSPDFKVELIVQKQPDTSTFTAHPPRAPSPPSSSASSASEPDTEPDSHWDSGEHPPPAPAPANSWAPRRPAPPPALQRAPPLRAPANSDRLCVYRAPVHSDGAYTYRAPLSTQATPYQPQQAPPPAAPANRDRLGTAHECDRCDRLADADCDSVSANSDLRDDEFHTPPHPYELFTKGFDLLTDNPTDALHPYKVLTDSETDVDLLPDPMNPTGDSHLYEIPEAERLVAPSIDKPSCDGSEKAYDSLPGNGHAKDRSLSLLPNIDSVPPAYDIENSLPGKNIPQSYELLPNKEEDDPPPAYKLLPVKSRNFNKPRLSLTDVRASWKEFSGKFSEHRKKRDKD